MTDEDRKRADKDNAGKPPLNLIPNRPMLEIAKVFAFGCKKYSTWNWTNGFSWSDAVGSAQRHLGAWQDGENINEESGISHWAHIGFWSIVMLTHEIYGLGEDDRWKPKSKR